MAPLRAVLSTVMDEALLREADAAPKLPLGRLLFEMLRQDGRRASDEWLAAIGAQLGHRSTEDIAARYLRPYTQQRDMAVA